MKQTNSFQKELKDVLLIAEQQLISSSNDYGGLGSGMGCGAANLKELHDNAQFIEMSACWSVKKAIHMMVNH